MRAGELCERKVVTGSPNWSVTEAAEQMRRHHVGDLVIVEGSNGSVTPIGIVTDRDLVVEALAREPDFVRSLSVSDVMTTDLVTADEDDDLAAVLSSMREHGVRRIPVVDARGHLTGILTYDDVLEWLVEQVSGLAGMIERAAARERASSTYRDFPETD